MLNDWPVVKPEYYNKELEEKWDKLLEVRDIVLKALEDARNKKLIGQSLQAKVVLKVNGKDLSFLNENKDILNLIFITSQTEITSLTMQKSK